MLVLSAAIRIRSISFLRMAAIPAMLAAALLLFPTSAKAVTITPPVPDLTVALVEVGTFRQGQSASYTVTVANSGSVPTNAQASVTVTLPVGLTATAMTGTGPNQTCNLPTLTCTLSDVVPSNGTYPAITLSVSVADTAPTSVVTTATVSGGGQTYTANDAASISTTVVKAPDLVITTSHSGGFIQGQMGATYTLTVSNKPSAGPTLGTVTVSDILPTGLTPIGCIGAWTCTAAGQTVTGSISTVLPAGLSYPTITVTVAVAPNAPPSVTNTANVSGGSETNSTMTDNSVSDPTTVIQRPDLILQNLQSGNFQQGQTGATYTLRVDNIGSGAAIGTITVVDTLPSGLTATAMSGTGWTCTLPTLSCSQTDPLLASTSSQDIILTVDVARDAAALVTNTAAVSGGGEFAAQQANNGASDMTTITQLPDLTIAQAAVGTFRVGDPAQYTLTVTNVGFAPTSGGLVTVTDSLPADLTYVGFTGSGWTCSAVGQVVTCTSSSVVVASATFPVITLNLTVAVNAGTSVVNAAVVGGADQVYTANDTATPVTTPVQQAPDLAITTTASTFTQGLSGTYTITVSNGVGSGPTVSNVTVTDTLPTNVALSGTSGSDWTCDPVVGQSLTCTATAVKNGGEFYTPLILSVNVTATAPVSLANTATLSAVDDANAANNSTTISTPVIQLPDLRITNSHASSFYRGQNGSPYTLTVKNIGPAPTTGMVTVTDTLPAAGLTASTISGAGWTCVLAPLPSCTRSDVLAPGASYPDITVKVYVQGGAPNLVTNQATVSTTAEALVGNNVSTDPTSIVNAPPPPTPPYVTIVAPLTDTRETTITVSGTANPFAVIDVNGASVQVDYLGKWQAVVALIEGPNVIRATNAPSSAMVTVNRDTLPPVIRLTASTDRTTEAEVDLTANSEPGAKILIEGKEGTTLRVQLHLGDNAFTATATDRAGNKATATVTVVRVAPKPKAPELNLLPEQVTKRSLTVSGKGTVGTRITLIVNGTTQTSATVDAAGRFSLNATLAVGKDRLYVQGIDGLTSTEATVEYQPPFTDLSGHWAATAFIRMYELGVVKGYEDNTCRPEATVTRIEFAVMIARLLKLAPVDAPLIFTDRDRIPTWATAPVAAAVKAGIIAGRPDGSFDPSASVTRAEMAVMLVRALRSSGLDTTPGNTMFVDEIPAWAKDDVAAAARYGLVTGYQDGTFRPGAGANRAEAVTTLSRLLDVIANK